MDAFAARISALDLVISVGNATVHLAGALGVPAWSILPLVPAWRWMLGGEQSLWYPSVRLFRQPERRNWSPVFESVAAALASRTGRTGAPRNRLAEHACHDVETPGQVLTLSDVTDTFASAVEAYHRNDYSQAEQVCLQILAHAPRDAKALHLRGLIARATGRLELAIKSIGLAIQVYGNDPQMHLHLAGALIEGGRLDEAIASYQRAIGLSPGVWALHFDLGSLLRTAGRREEAEQSLAQAIAIDPSNAKAYNALAGIQMEMLRWTDAEQTLRKALALKPDYMAAFNNLGQCLHFQGRLNEAAEQFRIAVKMDGACQQAVENLRAVEGELAREHRGGNPPGETVDSLVAQAARLYNEDRVDEAAAIAEQLLAVDENNVTALRVLGVAARQAADPGRSRELLERALAKKPDDYAIHFELGVTLAELRQTREALAHFQRVVQLRPTFHPACVNISAICEEQERYDEVVEWTGKALALKPDCALSYYNLANALRELGRIEEALDAYQRSRELNPKYIKADWNLGLSHLLLGDYQRGWPMFELRIDLREVAVDDYPQPRWDGASLAGKSILIHAEQGIGDEVLFASCFDEVISQARQCVIVCEPRLESLFRRSFPRATVYGYQRRKDCIGLKLKETFDVQIPAGSLPRFLRQTKADFPARDSFLQVDDRLLGFWRDRLAALGPGLKVGISWRAGGKPQERRKRMIPLELWRATLSTPDVQFVNLQYGDSSDEVAQIGRELGITIHDWEEGDPLVDMDSFAAKIKALDLVISVGNATVHIAGAVGTEAWTLLPMVPSWRWMVRGEQSPWYSAVRLFRQPKRGDWPSVMETIARRLRARVGTEIEPALATRQAADVSDDEYWYQANEVNTDAMIESIGVSLAEAERLVAAGELEAAEERYREVLQIAPRHYQALHGMGVVARLTGRSELAIRSFQRSLAMVEGVAVHQSNYAAALADAGREEEAVKAYSRALEIDPAISAARIELGLVLQKLGQHQQALVEFGKASLPGAEDAALLVYRGISLASQCRIDEAIECFEQSLRLNPSHVPALAALADVYLEDQQYEDAERCLRRAIAIRSDVPTWHLLLGRVLRREGEIGSALHSVEQAAELAPGDAAVLGELGAIYREAGEPELAAETLTRATEIEPENGELLTSLGLSLADGGKFAQAILCYDQALKLRPDYAAAHVNRAFALLSQGNLPDGWQEYEWRTKTSNAPRGRAWQIPAWRGESLDERSILVCGEQGVGEEILFASCYRDLLTRARQVVIVCQPRLEQLFRRSFPQATVLPVTRGQETTWRMPAGVHVDFQIAAGSLPTQLRGDRSCFDGARYLEASKAKISHWLARFAMLGDDLKVGVSWRTNGGPLDDPARGNLLDDWLPLLKTPGVQFVSLQPGDVRDELQQLALNHGVVVHHWNDADNTADLDGLAARMAALDLVISADGANLHLAGSLGVPAWALLPHVAGWHWLPVGEHDHRSLWYRSVRMFRQCRLGDWGELFGRAATELLNRARSKVEDSKKSPVAAPHVNLGGSGSPVFGSSPAGGLENS
jgi:tetratricopeptide (TPR) repeat protein/ADP-heptose:LPS heptosyltransferase